jgi:hypothetical protein
MTYQKYEEKTFAYEYSFAVDGGAISSITLRNLGINALAAGMIIEDIQILVTEAFAGSATPTCTLGISGTTAGFLADFYASASTINTPIRVGEVAGSLMWDDTNDHQISYRIPNAASAIPLLTIASQALTAGKMVVVFKVRVLA